MASDSGAPRASAPGASPPGASPPGASTPGASTPVAFTTNASLPIAAHRDAILDALRSQQVFIITGDTGSGKSTQLPQYCLQAGRGAGGLIAHTQPRRLAARALAGRIAEELGQAVGGTVGYRVRFADEVSAATRVILLTDGLLLAESSSDPLLSRYDTIIIDEAHERSLNIDLLLGVLRRLLPRRPDLTLIITSATLDVERMASFFAAPIIRVGGRGHPIEVRYAAQASSDDPDLPAEVLAAFQEISAEPGSIGGGDVLVFLPGEREIRDVSEFLSRELSGSAQVLSLYSRMPWQEQRRIFQPSTRRRIILSTNVAETAVTVPGIRSVIDSGLARISRYAMRNRLQRLPVEAISKANAAQRAGRCGRLGPGLCMRLYSEADYVQRAQFTEPEVLRTNLAGLLLRLAADGLGDAADFPFIDPPDTRALNDGYRLLQELQAFDADKRITRHGRAMARLPLDPRLARALLESQRFHAEAEILIIASALSVPEVTGKAAEDSKSEFSAIVKLWHAYRKARQGSRRELRHWCAQRQFSLLRLSEWDDVYHQLADRAGELGISAQRKTASYAGVHRALLAGFCTMVGTRGEEGVYAGTRSVQFRIFPGSSLAKRRPRWVMAASIVETSRVFARWVAQVEPKWIESAAAHLLKREYLAPDWDDEREAVTARERVSLLGLILSANRSVNYGPIAPEESRRIFAREALVYQRLGRRPAWLTRNDAQIRAARAAEERLRTRALLQDAEAFVEFYVQALPRQVSSAVTLDHFSRNLSSQQADALRLDPDQIFARQPDPAELAPFPQTLACESLQLPVDYRFAPGEADDGATVNTPLLAVPALTLAQLSAAVPGFEAARVEALLRSLPKEARRHLIPITASAARFLQERHSGAAEALELRAWLQHSHGIPEGLLAFDVGAVPAHLWLKLAVRAAGDSLESAVLARIVLDRDTALPELRRRCAAAVRAELARQCRSLLPAPDHWRRFEIDRIPERLPLPVEAGVLEAGVLEVFPCLARHGASLQLHLAWSAEEARTLWRAAAARLARLQLPAAASSMAKTITASAPLLLGASPYAGTEQLIDALLQVSFRRACFAETEAPRERTAFEAAVSAAQPRLQPMLEEIMAAAVEWFDAARRIRAMLDFAAPAPLAGPAQESREHIRRLLQPEGIGEAAESSLHNLPRYLQAELRRWQRNAVRGREPESVLRELGRWAGRLRGLEAQLRAEPLRPASIEELRFALEEYRVSLYAQELKTAFPVSAERLEQRFGAIEAWIKR